MGFSNFDILLADSPPSSQVVASDWSTGSDRHPLDANIDKLVKEFDGLLIRPSSTEEAIQDYGARLFGLVFGDEVRTAFERSLATTNTRGDIIRIRLRFDGPSLARLPWELLFSKPERFLSTSERATLCRILQVAQPTEPLKVKPPIRTLVVSCGPQGLKVLNHDEERSRIERALAQLLEHKDAELEFIAGAELGKTAERLQKEEFHILHFIGHGDVVDGEGIVFFEDGSGGKDKVNAGLFANLTSVCPTLRLVVLNSCSTARESSRKAFASVASQLVSSGVPAVIAMQAPIEDRVAIAFAGTLYGHLAGEEPIDRAMTRVRQRLQLELGASKTAFCTPVLYMQSADGRLFDLRSSERRALINSSQCAERLNITGEALVDWKDLHHTLQSVGKEISRACEMSRATRGADLLNGVWEDVEIAVNDSLLPFAQERMRFIGRRYSAGEEATYGEEWASRTVTIVERIKGLLNRSDDVGRLALGSEMERLRGLITLHMQLANAKLLGLQQANRELVAEILALTDDLRNSGGAPHLNWSAIEASMMELKQSSDCIGEWLGIHEVYDGLHAKVGEMLRGGAPEQGTESGLGLWSYVKSAIYEGLLEKAARIAHIGKPYAMQDDGILEGEPWAVDIKVISDRLDKCIEVGDMTASAGEMRNLEKQILRHYILLDNNVKKEIDRFNVVSVELRARITP